MRAWTPSSKILPESAWINPERIFMRVLLPAPFSPSTPWIVPEGMTRRISSLASTSPKCLWIPSSSIFMGIRKRGEAHAPPPVNRTTGLLGDALALHALKQLGQVPDLKIRPHLAIRKIGRAVLEIQRAGPEVQAAGQAEDEVLQRDEVLLSQGGARRETDGRGIRVVDIGPIRAVPEEARREAPLGGATDRLEISRPPVEVGDAEADRLGFVTGADVVVGGRPPGFVRRAAPGGVDQRLRGGDAGDYDVVAAVEELIGPLRRGGGEARG